MKPEREKKEGRKNLLKSVGMDKLLILAICGVIFIIISLPSGQQKKVTKQTVVSTPQNREVILTEEEYCSHLEKRLEELLSKMEGVGQTKVMVTLKSTKENVVLKEAAHEQSDRKEQKEVASANYEENSYKNNEVVVYEKDAKGNMVPFVVKENMPQIEGIAVVAKGGEIPGNVLKITNTLLALFNIEAHKISVIGMR